MVLGSFLPVFLPLITKHSFLAASFKLNIEDLLLKSIARAPSKKTRARLQKWTLFPLRSDHCYSLDFDFEPISKDDLNRSPFLNLLRLTGILDIFARSVEVLLVSRGTR